MFTAQDLLWRKEQYKVFHKYYLIDSRPVTSEVKYAGRRTHDFITVIHFNIQCNGIRRHGALSEIRTRLSQ